MDGDGPCIAAAEKAINKLAEAGIYSKILILPGNKDLCELAIELKYDIQDYIKLNALTYGQHKMQKIVNSYDSQINELKLKNYKDIKKVLEEIPYESKRMVMKEYILKRMNMRF